MLLIKREDNGLWAMPGGATEVGETWAQSAERELREETGVVGTAKKLLGVFDSRIWGSRSKYHFYAGVWLVEASDDRAPIAGPETTDVGFFAEHDLPAGAVAGTCAPDTDGVQARAWRPAGAVLRPDDLNHDWRKL